MSDRLEEAIANLKTVMRQDSVYPPDGLPESLFLFASTLMPVANIDLFITDKKNRVLLTWRDDKFYGYGWHIPGGCIRVREALDSRIQKTAKEEIGCNVNYDKNPIVVRESFVTDRRPWLNDELERSHNISMLFHCSLPEDYTLDNTGLNEHDPGYKRWFAEVPNDLLKVHCELYGDILENYFNFGGNEND